MRDQARLRALRRHVKAVAGFICASITASASAQPLTLDQALERALSTSPAIRAAQAALPAIEGELAEARAPLFNNPQISGEYGTRDTAQAGAPSMRDRDWAVAFSQTFEIAGQQRLRRESGLSARAAAEHNVNEVRAQIVMEVADRFIKVLGLEARITAEEETLALVERSAQAIARRVEAGEDSVLDSNLARVEAERARNSVAALREQLIQTNAELGGAIQWPPAEPLQIKGSLDQPPHLHTLQELLDSAVQRPLLRTLELKERAARSRLSLERSLVYPDITLGISHAKEGPSDGRERITLFTMSVPLPVFKRNQAGIGRAQTELTQVEIDRQSAARQVEAQVRTFWARRQNLLERVTRLNQALLPRLTENQELTRKAFDAGELGLSQLLLANRQLIDAQRELIEARTELRLATIALDAAAGLTLHGNAESPLPKPIP